MRRRRHKASLESVAALEDAQANLAQTKARTREVTEVSRAMRLLRERNHFREQTQLIMEWRYPHEV